MSLLYKKALSAELKIRYNNAVTEKSGHMGELYDFDSIGGR